MDNTPAGSRSYGHPGQDVGSAALGRFARSVYRAASETHIIRRARKCARFHERAVLFATKHGPVRRAKQQRATLRRASWRFIRFPTRVFTNAPSPVFGVRWHLFSFAEFLVLHPGDPPRSDNKRSTVVGRTTIITVDDVELSR